MKKQYSNPLYNNYNNQTGHFKDTEREEAEKAIEPLKYYWQNDGKGNKIIKQFKSSVAKLYIY